MRNEGPASAARMIAGEVLMDRKARRRPSTPPSAAKTGARRRLCAATGAAGKLLKEHDEPFLRTHLRETGCDILSR